MGGAVNTTSFWVSMLDPPRSPAGRAVGQSGLLVIAEMLAKPLMLLFRQVPKALLLVLVRNTWRASQRAEYRADRLASEVAGRPAVMTLMESLYSLSTLLYVVQRVHTYWRDRDPIDEYVRLSAERTPRDVARLRRMELTPGSRVDSTHPATADRIAVLESVPSSPPSLLLSPARSAAIDAELAGMRRAASRALTRGGWTPADGSLVPA
jgi:hypothetical protein